MRFNRSTAHYRSTLIKALPIFGFVCALFPRVSAQAQERLLRVVNDQYDLRFVKADGVALTVVPGIEAGPDEDAFPVRRVLVEMPSADAAVSLRGADESEPLRALPFYRVRWKLATDSVLTPEYYPAEAPGRSVPPAILASRQFKRDGRFYTEAQVPLFSWDAGKSEARWINAYTFAVTVSDAPGPATAEERPGGYFTQPFILRSADLDTLGAWIPASREGIKFHVREDGVYALTAEWLSRAGVTAASLDPARLRLVRKGKELPLLGVGTEDGRLDDGDALIFIGERNYDEKGYRRLPSHIDDPYPQYLNKYSDSAAYWLFMEGEPGRRIPVGAQPAAPSDTIDWAFKLIHHEPEERLFAVSTDYVRQQVSDWGADKTWFETCMRTGTIHMTFEVDNLKEGKSAHVWQKSGSWAGNPSVRPHHKMLIGVNDGPALDSVEFDVNWQGLLHGRAPAGQLRDGENGIDITNVKLYEGDNELYLDWFDVE